MAESIVLKFYSPVNEASIGRLLKAVDEKLASGVEVLELVKSLRVDMDNCASVVAANTNRTKKQVLRAMLARTTLHPEAALEWGLAHEIRQQLFEDGVEVISIQAGG